jgi:hypothetical protein
MVACFAEQLGQTAQHHLATSRCPYCRWPGSQVYIIGSDQFGMYLFPQARWMWVHKGDSEVKGSLTEDKRQYTGDIVHNDRGDVIAVHVIFAGKTNASLPHPKV